MQLSILFVSLAVPPVYARDSRCFGADPRGETRRDGRVHWNMSIETVLTGNVNLPRAEASRKHVYRSFDPSDASVHDVRLYLWRARSSRAEHPAQLRTRGQIFSSEFRLARIELGGLAYWAGEREEEC